MRAVRTGGVDCSVSECTRSAASIFSVPDCSRAVVEFRYGWLGDGVDGGGDGADCSGGGSGAVEASASGEEDGGGTSAEEDRGSDGAEEEGGARMHLLVCEKAEVNRSLAAHPAGQVVGNARQRETLYTWLRGAVRGDTVLGSRPLASEMRVLVGPPGCGKTLTAVSYMERIGLDVVKINASDMRTATSLGRILASSGNSVGLGKPVGVVLDEIDGLYVEDRTSDMFRSIHCRNPVIATCNSFPAELRRRLDADTIIRFFPLYQADVEELVRRELRRAHAPAQPWVVTAIAENANGDGRQVRAAVYMRSSYSAKDEFGGVFSVVQSLLPEGRGIATAIELGDAETEQGLLADLIHEHHPLVCSRGSIWDISSLMDVLSFSDTLRAAGKHDDNNNLLYTSSMVTRAGARACASTRAHTAKASRRKQFLAYPVRGARQKERDSTQQRLMHELRTYSELNGEYLVSAVGIRNMTVEGSDELVKKMCAASKRKAGVSVET